MPFCCLLKNDLNQQKSLTTHSRSRVHLKSTPNYNLYFPSGSTLYVVFWASTCGCIEVGDEICILLLVFISIQALLLALRMITFYSLRLTLPRRLELAIKLNKSVTCLFCGGVMSLCGLFHDPCMPPSLCFYVLGNPTCSHSH